MELNAANEVSHLRVVTPRDGFLQCAGFAETRNQVRHCHASCIPSSTSVLQTPFPSPHRPKKEKCGCTMLPTPFPSPDKSEELTNCHRHFFQPQFLSIPKETSPLAQRKLLGTLESFPAPLPAFGENIASQDQQDIQSSHLRHIADLEMRLKLSMENEKKGLELIIRGEKELFACRQEQAREREEREQERQVARKQAVDFVESEILALNELCLDLETRLEQAEMQRDQALATLSDLSRLTEPTRKTEDPTSELAQVVKKSAAKSVRSARAPAEVESAGIVESENKQAKSHNSKSNGAVVYVDRCVRCRTCSGFLKFAVLRAWWASCQSQARLVNVARQLFVKTYRLSITKIFNRWRSITKLLYGLEESPTQQKHLQEPSDTGLSMNPMLIDVQQPHATQCTNWLSIQISMNDLDTSTTWGKAPSAESNPAESSDESNPAECSLHRGIIPASSQVVLC